MEYKPEVWNPLWRALERAQGLIPQDAVEFDPVALCSKPGITEKVDHIALAVQDWEKVAPGDQYAVIKASYLLGLVVGLKYARAPQATFDKIIESYKEEK